MNAWFDEVTLNVATLATEILGEDSQGEVGFIAYGDHCDGPGMIQDSTLESGSTPKYTRNATTIEKWLSQGHRTEGGDIPEAVECVLKHVADVHLPNLPDGTQLLVFWVGDAGPHRPVRAPWGVGERDDGCPLRVDWQAQLQRLAVGGVPIYTALCGGDSWAREVWGRMASDTGGVAVDLRNIRNLLTTMIAVVKKETGGLDAYAREVRGRGADAEMEEVLIDLGATCYDK